jgi:uncharacterized protein YidB (DUF937 family)
MLEKLIASALQGMGQQQQGGGDLMQVVTSLLAGNVGSNGSGGLAALVQQFQQAGMGEHLSSWISTGENLPINADQLMQVFGQGNMQQMAQAAGMNSQDLGSQLSSMLPQLIDKLTPNGELPSADAAGGGLDQALASLSQLMPR